MEPAGSTTPMRRGRPVDGRELAAHGGIDTPAEEARRPSGILLYVLRRLLER